MKKLTLAAALVIAFASMTYAQTTGNQTVTINTYIIRSLILGSPSGPLNFGAATNHTIVLGAVSGPDTIVTVATTDARAVKLQVTGDAAQSIAVSYSASANLTSGANTIVYTPDVGFSLSSSGPATSDYLVAGGTFTLGGSKYASASGYIWVGGKISNAAGGITAAQPGTYSGTLTITVSYTAL